MKIGRNEKCFCGSGKKYKKCCIGNLIELPASEDVAGEELKDAKQFSEMVKNHFEGSEFSVFRYDE